MRRTWPLHLLLALLLAALGGFAWLTHHPGVPWLAEAEAWPLLGPLAAAFRERYLPPPGADGALPGSDTGEGGVEVIVVYVPGEPPATPGAQGEVRGAVEQIWLQAGTALSREPREGAPAVAHLAAIANLPVLERRGEWARVTYREVTGWVKAPWEGGSPPLGSAPEPPRPVPALTPDPALLARGLSLLGGRSPAGSLGPYTLYTDHSDPGLLAFLDRAAAGVEEVYRQRYRRSPVGEAAEAVLLFSREEGYRAFQESDPRLTGLQAAGHAGHGLIALYVDGRPRWELAGTLVHEVTHLLNRRALGPALPPWLDEGMAGDLGSSAFAPGGAIEAGTLGGEVRRSGERIDFHGPRASVRHLVEALDGGTFLPLPELFRLSWEEFVRPPASELHYAESAFLVRYLVEGEGGGLAPGFHSFLAAVSEGGPATGEALAEHLSRPWARTEPGLRAWLRFAEHATRLAAGVR